jgi:hypothetical protein
MPEYKPKYEDIFGNKANEPKWNDIFPEPPKKKESSDLSEEVSASPSEVQSSLSKAEQTPTANTTTPTGFRTVEPFRLADVVEQNQQKIISEEEQRRVTEETRQQIQSLLPNIQQTISDIDSKAKAQIGPATVFGFGKEQEALLATRRLLRGAEKMIKAPDKEGVRSFISGIRRGDLANLFSLGYTGGYNSLKTLQLAKKMDGGYEPTDEEYMLLAGKYLYDVVDANKPKTSSYNVGAAIAEMVPFIGQIYLTGGIGSAATGAASATAKKALSASTVAVMKKYGLDAVLKAAVGAAAQTPFTAMFMQKYAQERMPSLEMDADGRLVPTQGENRVEAATDAFGSTFSSLFSEKAGELIRKGVTTLGAKLAPAINNPSQAVKSINALRKNLNWSGAGYEFLEEQLDGIGQAITTEEATLSDLFNVRQQFETLATIMVASAGMKALEIPGYLKEKQYKKELDNATKVFDERIDPTTKQIITSAINLDNIEEMQKRLSEEDLSYLTPEQNKVVLDYMKAKIGYNTLFTAENTKVEEPSETSGKPKTAIAKTETPQSDTQVSPEGETDLGVSKIDDIAENLPDNVIRTPEGLFELNEAQQEQRKQMTEKYGKQRADELIIDFIDANDLRKYTEDPFKVEKKEQDVFNSRQELLNLQEKEYGELDRQNREGDNRGQMGRPQRVGENIPATSPSQPRYDDRGSRRSVGDNTVLKTYSIQDSEASQMSSANPNLVFDKSFNEVSDPELFHKSISDSKTGNKYAASVFVYPQEDYAKYRKFLTDDGLAGAAIDDKGTIISVFSHGKGKGRGAQVVFQAIKEGGNKLDHYDTRLSDYYYDFGFVPVARVKWDDQYAPEDWDKETFKKYNNGEPDVILMAYHGGNPNTLSSRYGKFGNVQDALNKTPYVESFEEGQKLQEQYLKRIGGQPNANEVSVPTEIPLGNEPTISTEVRGGDAGQQEVTGEGQVTQPTQEAPNEARKAELKKRIADNFDNLITGIGGSTSLMGEQRPDPLKAMRQIAEDVFELGALSVDDLITKIKDYLKQKPLTPENLKTISDYIDNNRNLIRDIYVERGKQRKFAKRLLEDEDVSDEIKTGLSEDAKMYIPTGNKVTMHEADVIIQEKGLTESILMVKDKNNGLFPRVRVALGEAVINAYNKILNEADPESSEWKDAAKKSVDIAEFMTMYGTELGQGVQAYAIWSKLNSRVLTDKIIADIEKNTGRKLTDKELDELKRLADRVKKAPDGFQKFNATTDLLGYEARIKGIKLADLAMSVWYAHILSGYKTQELNFLANTANTAMELVKSAIYSPKSTLDLLRGLYDGYGRGLLELWSVLKTGYDPMKGAKFEFTERQATPSALESYEGFKLFGKQWNPLKLHRYVPRVMVGVDSFFYYGLQGMRLHELVHRQTKGLGMSKAEVERYISEKLLKTKELKEKAIAQAKKEGLKGIDIRRRMWEIMEQGLPDELHDDANNIASRGTFNFPPEGRIGRVTDLVANIANQVKFGDVKPIKFIVPFTNILSNVANTYLDYSPYGFVRAARGSMGGKQDMGTKYTRKYTQEERTKEIIAATLGTIAGLTLFWLATKRDDQDEPTIEITANGTNDYVKNYNLQETGWQKYSVKIGDTWYSYQNTPLAIPLTVVGNIMDARNYQGRTLEDKDMLKRTEIILWNTAQYFTDLTFLRGVSEFLSSFNESDPTKASGYFEKYLQNVGKGFVVPNIVTQVSRKIQQTYNMPMKEANDTWEQMYRDIPIARNKLNEMTNALGEPVVANMNRWTNKEEDDPIWQLIVDNEAWLNKPSKSIVMYDTEGNTRLLNEEEYYQYAKLRGQLLKDLLEEHYKELMNMDKAEVQDRVAQYANDAADKARYKLRFGKYSK